MEFLLQDYLRDSELGVDVNKILKPCRLLVFLNLK